MSVSNIWARDKVFSGRKRGTVGKRRDTESIRIILSKFPLHLASSGRPHRVDTRLKSTETDMYLECPLALGHTETKERAFSHNFTPCTPTDFNTRATRRWLAQTSFKPDVRGSVFTASPLSSCNTPYHNSTTSHTPSSHTPSSHTTSQHPAFDAPTTLDDSTA